MRRGFTRKRFIVKPEYQIKLALKLFIYLSVFSMIFAFAIFYPLYSELNSATTLDEQARISSIVLFLHKRIWIGLFLVSFIAAAHAILSSHRVVGPMYRFEKMMDALIKGDYSMRIKIRKKDEFKEMESLLNRLGEILELEKNRDVQFHADMKIRLEMVSAMLEAEGAFYPEDVRKLMQKLVHELNTRMSFGQG